MLFGKMMKLRGRKMSESKFKSKLKKKIEDVFDVGTEGAVSIIGELAGESLFGTFAPGITTAIFSYKQKRFEKNINKAIDELKKREAELNERLSAVENRQSFIESFELIWDYIIDEPQEQKIKYMINGLVNLASHEQIKEDFVLFYYDTLRDLRLVDIDVLNLYYLSYSPVHSRVFNYHDILEKFDIDYNQYNAVREKLVRMGLLKTKHTDDLDKLYKNVLTIQEYLDGKSKKLNRLERLSKSDGYSISSFGRNFVEFFLEKYTSTESDVST
jgi:hypothetical protein